MGTSVLALRGIAIRASNPLPGYEQALLGGSSLLRGYEFGYRAGDNLAAVSAELRIPITSPLSVGRFGVKAFVDAGTVYGAGGKLATSPSIAVSAVACGSPRQCCMRGWTSPGRRQASRAGTLGWDWLSDKGRDQGSVQ